MHERRDAVRAEYDAEASEYDANPYPTTMHATFIDRLVATCPVDGVVLDAPCGTGQYFARIRGAGRRVVGIDQSAGMLEQARQRNLAEDLRELGLQEMAFDGVFDAAMAVDAMENIPPEDWPVVIRNLRRAVRAGGNLYITVEEIDEEEIETAWRENRDLGIPAVRGEVIEDDTAGYHYYPGRPRVLEWLAAEGLEVIDDASDQQDGWVYWHLFLSTPTR